MQKINPYKDAIIATGFLFSCFLAGFLVIWIKDDISRPIFYIWTLSFISFGTLIGFIFGIPKVLQEDKISQNIKNNSEKNNYATNYRTKVNTNLEQISDWLTKMIVGIGLVELKNLPKYIHSIAVYVSQTSELKSENISFSAALAVNFSIVVFLGGYLLTRIYLSAAFTRADVETQKLVQVGRKAVPIEKVQKQQSSMISDLQDTILNWSKLKQEDSKEINSNFETDSQEKTLEERNEAGDLQRMEILWVDDNYVDNALLIDRMENIGIKVLLSSSTGDALEKIQKSSFDRFVSNMARTENNILRNKAGLELLKSVRKKGLDTPFLIYCSSKEVVDYENEAREYGVNEITSSSTVLLRSLKID